MSLGRAVGLAAVLVSGGAGLGCSTPRQALKEQLGGRAAREFECPEAALRYQELDRLISTTKVRITGCGKVGTWRLVESRWVRVSNDEPLR